PSFLFSLRRSLSHPTLHSFPTRRSSDLFPLRRVSFACETDGHRKRARAGPANAPRLRGDEQAQSRPQRRGGCGFPGSALGAAYRDRKSTRLNSSHLGISYAVFCLKKKK